MHSARDDDEHCNANGDQSVRSSTKTVPAAAVRNSHSLGLCSTPVPGVVSKSNAFSAVVVVKLE